jgi:rhamnosyltransferase
LFLWGIKPMIFNDEYSSISHASCVSDRLTCSVMMATYRPSVYLCDQVTSILRQEGLSLNLLISDDSEDKSLLMRLLPEEILPTITHPVSQVNVIDGPQDGVASANFFNLVLQNSVDADFYAFADQDDVWSSNKLAEAIMLLQQTGSDCYSSELLIWFNSSPPSSSVISKRWQIKKHLFGLFFAESAGCTYLMSRRAFLSLKQRLSQIAEKNLLHHVFSHDLFTSAFLHSQGFKWYHDRNSMIYYRQHESNAWGTDVMSFAGLKKRLSLLNGQYYYVLLYLAWMGSAQGTIASQLWLSLSRLGLRDRLFLLRSAFNASTLFSVKTAGLLMFLLFTRKHQPTPCVFS